MDQLERQIITEILNGRTERFDYIVRNYGRRVFALIVRMVPCREDAEELAQDAMVKVFAHLADFRGDSELSSWIYRIAFTTAMSAVRAPAHARGACGRGASAGRGRFRCGRAARLHGR